MTGPPPRPPFHRRAMAWCRSMVDGLLRRNRIEADMREEFRTHIEMRTDDLVARGMSQAEASRRAHVEFGHVESHRAAARAARGLRWVDRLRFSWVDVRLGLRMMVKHPGLTLVAMVALALGIPTGMAPMHLAEALDRPLPEDSGNRIRTVRFWDPASGVMTLPTEGDLEILFDESSSFESLGAFRNGAFNLASPDGRAASVPGAEVTAAALAMLEVAPLMGRLLDSEDERPGGTDVVLLGHDVWSSRFGGDPEVVGSTVLVGRTPHTVVGVMPEGFFFPFRDQLWVPLRRSPATGPGEGPPLRVVARLADGVTTDEAHAEVSRIRLPDTHPANRGPSRLALEVVPFSYMYVGLPRGGFGALPEFHFMRLLGGLLLLVACANVAMLVFARTATRFRELAVRTALGAGRSRIVSQVFVETLVLAVCSAGAGLLVVDVAIRRVPWEVMAGSSILPYWVDLGVPMSVLPWAALFTVMSATVAGVVPALRITRGDIHGNIRAADSGRSGVRFGGVTGALIVADVALAVGVIGFAVGITGYLNELADSDLRVGVPAEEFLAVELRRSMNETPALGEAAASSQSFGAVQERLRERLASEAGVRAAVFADALPRMNHRSRLVRVDGPDRDDASARWVRVARVDVDFFSQLRQPILAGRDFDRGDIDGDVRPVIVNARFVEEMIGGEGAVGRRIRLVSSAESTDDPWHEIVGVVGRLGMNTVSRNGSPGVYFVEPAGSIHPVQLGVHVGIGPEEFAPRLREIVSETDPSVIVGTPVVLGEVQQGDWYVAVGITAAMSLLVGILIALAASGIYAIVSFSVSERTREIGIRSALGASRTTLAYTILRRALAQLGLGALFGIPLAAWLLLQLQDPDAERGAMLATIARSVALGLGTVGLVGLVSCVAPARRALAIDANDALRAE